MKRILTIIPLCILAIFMLAACGDNGDDPPSDGDTDISETDSPDSDGDGIDAAEEADLTDGDSDTVEQDSDGDVEEDQPAEQDVTDTSEDVDDTDNADVIDDIDTVDDVEDTDTLEQDSEPDIEPETPEEELEESIEPGDAYEPDDNAAQASPLHAITPDGTGQTHDFSDDPTDLIPLDCVANQSVFIMVTPYLNETYEYILDDQDNEIASFTHIDGQIEHNMTDRILWTCDATARRYIKVANGLGRVNDDDGYIIRVWSPVPADACEEDDSRDAACALQAIPDAPDTLNDDSRTFFDDAEDWFSFAADASTVYTITVTGIDDNVRPGLAVYLEGSDNPADEEHNFGSNQSSVTITLPVTDATTVSGRIVNTNDKFGVNTAYRLEIYKEASTATDYFEMNDIDSFTNNDELGDAETVPVGANCHFRFTHRSGLFQEDWDCVTFAAQAAIPYRVSAQDAVYGDTSDTTKFRVYDNINDGHYDGFLRGSSDTSGEPNTGPQTFVPEAGATYFVCFYSDISVPMDEWATYDFSITEAAR